MSSKRRPMLLRCTGRNNTGPNFHTGVLYEGWDHLDRWILVSAVGVEQVVSKNNAHFTVIVTGDWIDE